MLSSYLFEQFHLRSPRHQALRSDPLIESAFPAQLDRLAGPDKLVHLIEASEVVPRLGRQPVSFALHDFSSYTVVIPNQVRHSTTRACYYPIRVCELNCSFLCVSVCLPSAADSHESLLQSSPAITLCAVRLRGCGGRSRRFGSSLRNCANAWRTWKGCSKACAKPSVDGPRASEAATLLKVASRQLVRDSRGWRFLLSSRAPVQLSSD